MGHPVGAGVRRLRADCSATFSVDGSGESLLVRSETLQTQAGFGEHRPADRTTRFFALYRDARLGHPTTTREDVANE